MYAKRIIFKIFAIACIISLLSILLFPVLCPAGGVQLFVFKQYQFGVFPPGNWIDGYKSAVDLKITQPRIIFSWNDFEPEKGKFNLERYDAFMNFATKVNFKPIVTIRSDSSWGTKGGFHQRASSPPIDMQDYIEFVTFLADRYRGQVGGWQIENEIYDHSTFWDGTREEYIDLLQNAYQAIKKVDPAGKVVLNGIANYLFVEVQKGNEEATEFLDFLMSHGDYFDVIDFHYYLEPDHIISTVDILNNLMEKYGYTKPLIITEAGDLDLRLFSQHLIYARTKEGSPVPVVEKLLEIKDVRDKLSELLSRDGDRSSDLITFATFLSENHRSRPIIEKYQAENLVKRVCLAFSLGIESFNWLGMIELREPDTPDWFFAIMPLMNHDGTHKPAYYTYKLLIDKLEDIHSAVRINEHVVRFYYKDFRPPVYIAWTDDGEEKIIDLSDEVAGEIELLRIITKRGQTDEDAVVEKVRSDAIPISSTPIILSKSFLD